MNEESNYGINTLTKDKIEAITTYTTGPDSGYWGPVIEKDGKYYITTLKEDVDVIDLYNASINGTYKDEDYYNVAMIINKSMSPDDAKSIINHYDKTPKTTDYDINKLSEYIKEVESATGKEVESVNLRQDSKVDISLIDTDGKIKEAKEIEIIEKNDSNVFNKYDVNNVLEQVGVEKKYTSDEKLNDENKKVIENYLNQIIGNDVKIKKDTDGNYIATVKTKKTVDGKEIEEEEIITKFGKNSTLGEAVYQINEDYKKSKSLDDFEKDNKSNRVKHRQSGGKIFINVNAFNQVTSSNTSAKGILDGCKGKYSSGCLTDKLLAAHNSIVGSNPANRISGVSNLIGTLNKNIKYSLKAYENIDHNLGLIINSIISEIFAMSSYKNNETKEFYNGSIDDREKALENIINNLEARIGELKDEYEKKYPNGLVNLDETVSDLIIGIGNAFNFTDDSEVEKNGIPGLSLLNTIDFIQQNDLLGKMTNYADGQNWQTSGLAKIYYDRFNITKDLDVYDENDHIMRENEFLKKYIKNQTFESNSSLKTTRQVMTSSPALYRVNDSELSEIKAYMKGQLEKLKSYYGTVLSNETGKEEELNSIDLIKYYANDCVAYEDAIATASSTKKNYEMYRKIMPYEADMQGDTYLEYLTQDYSKLDVDNILPELGDNIKYMSQSEIALYCMYKGIKVDNPTFSVTSNKNEENANNYLLSITDLINQRHGLEDAVLRLEDYNDWLNNGGVGGLNAFLKSGADGFGDGIEGFFDGINNCFLNDGEKSYRDYRNTYMLSLLDSSGENALDLNIDSNVKAILKRNYSVFKSVGNMVVPTLASFIPTVGPYASKVLYGLSSLGSSVEMAKQGGSDAASAYLYGGVSALSNLAMNKLMSGIVGLNGNLTPPEGALENLMAMGKQGGRATAGVYVDALWRSTILGQPVDFSSLPAEAFDTAINGMLTAAALNGTTKISIKLADGFVYHFGDKYNSYQDLLKANAIELKEEFKNSKLYQKLKLSKFAGGDKWERDALKYDKTIVGKWLKELDNESKDALLDLTKDSESILKYSLKSGEKLIYDNNTKNYYIYNEQNGSALTVPSSFMSDREGAMNIKLTSSEQLLLNIKQNMGKIYDIKDGKLVINTEFADKYYHKNADGSTYINPELLLYLTNKLDVSSDLNQRVLGDLTLSELALVADGLNELLQQDSGGLYDHTSSQNIRVLKYMNQFINADYNTTRDLLYYANHDFINAAKKVLDYATNADIDRLVGTFEYYTDKDKWLNFVKSKGFSDEDAADILGLHSVDGTNYMLITDTDVVKHATHHEGIHGLGHVYQRGLDEVLTEYAANLVSTAQGIDVGVGYSDGVIPFTNLVTCDMPGLTQDDWLWDYFVAHDLSDIKNTIDSSMGEGYFDTKFVPAFDTVLVNSEDNDIKITPEEAIDKIIKENIGVTHETWY